MTITSEADYLSAADPGALLQLRRTDCCGCLWRDNGDGTVSLCQGQRPCGQCDNGPITPYPPFSDRQLRLWCVACLGQCNQEMLRERNRQGCDDYSNYGSEGENISLDVLHMVAGDWAGSQRDYDPAPAAKASLLRSIIGNPFRPVTLSEHILTPTVRQIAQVIYAAFPSVEPDHFAALADALREAGLEETRRCQCCQGEGGWWTSAPKWNTDEDFDWEICPECNGHKTIPDDAAIALLRHLTPDAGAPYGRERCPGCLGAGGEQTYRGHGDYDSECCALCHGTGWSPRQTPWVRGDWAIELLRGETP